MKRMLLTAAALLAVMIMLNVSTANAADYRSKGAGPADWADYTSWQICVDGEWRDAVSGEVPDADDFATIRATQQIDVAAEDPDQSADHIDVAGALHIEAGRTLTLDGSSSATSYVSGNGQMYLEVSGSTGSFLAFTTTDQVLSYVSTQGKITGAGEAAEIRIADSRKLTSQIIIDGSLKIAPAPSASSTRFINGTGGLVHANAAGTLDLQVDELDEWVTGSNEVRTPGDWQVSTSPSAVLRFTTGSYYFSGRFDVDAGTLDIVASKGSPADPGVCTTGILDQQGGGIDVAGSKCFGAGGTCPCQ